MYAMAQYYYSMTEKQVATRVDEETAKEIRVLAAMNDESVADWLRDAIKMKLETEEGNSNQMAATAN